MTEEEYFRKNYPDSCYGDKTLSPHWDFFQDGVEFGERQSEKRIEELEKENAELKAVERMALYSKMSDRLAKAKEILREYIRINLLPPIERNFDDEVKLFKEAEQFLNSKEEKEMTENSNVPECPSIKIGCDKMYYVDEVKK